MFRQLLRPLVSLVCGFYAIACHAAYGQIARAYLNAPQGNLAMYSYSGVRSNTGGVESLPIPLTETRLQTQSLIFSKILDIDGRTGGLGVVLPFQDLLSYNTQSNAVTARESGMGDPSVTFEMNLFGAPALQREDFKDWIPEDYCGLHFTFGLPLGKYDPSSAVNLGANRFTFRPLLNYSITPDEGKSWFDFYSSIALYTANDEYLNSSVLKQSPLTDIELHYSRTVYDRLWAGVGVVGLFGGQVEVNDVVTTPTQQVGRFALSAGTPMFKGSTAIFSFNHTFARSEGAAVANTFIIQIIYVF
jgi:hypothetical protein